MAGVGGVDVPAEAAAGGGFWGLDGGHEGDGFGGEDAGFSVFSAVEDHAAEAGEVGGGGEEAGVTGDAAHSAGGGVVDGAAEDGVVGEEFGGCDAGVGVWWDGCGGVEATVPGVFHAEWGEDFVGAEGF